MMANLLMVQIGAVSLDISSDDCHENYSSEKKDFSALYLLIFENFYE